MKAVSIDPEHCSLEPIDIQGREDIAERIGYDTLESDAVGTAGDRLYFDEECFLRGTKGRFQIDSVIPMSGKAVLIGTGDDGTTLRDVATDIDSLRSRIKYLCHDNLAASGDNGRPRSDQCRDRARVHPSRCQCRSPAPNGMNPLLPLKPSEEYRVIMRTGQFN